MKKGVKIGLIIIAVILVIGGCSYAAANLAMDSMLNKMEHAEKIENDDAEIAPEVSEAVKERNIVNIALFGADNSQGPTGTDEDRSDAMKIVSQDFDNKKLKITSKNVTLLSGYQVSIRNTVILTGLIGLAELRWQCRP